MSILSNRTHHEDDAAEKKRLQNIEYRNRVAIDQLTRSGAFRINPNWTKPQEVRKDQEPKKPE